VTHQPIDTDLVHDTYSDVSEVHPDLSAEQAELLGILGWCAACGPARLTLRQWQTVDRLIAWRRAPGIPIPRQSPEASPSSSSPSSSRSTTP
jgi:hypothetical protein